MGVLHAVVLFPVELCEDHNIVMSAATHGVEVDNERTYGILDGIHNQYDAFVAGLTTGMASRRAQVV
jgi:hypothetical protein